MKNHLISIFIIGFAILILFYIRMAPAIGNTIEFTYDRVFNYRMTTEVIRNGDVPTIDRLSTYPEGKNIKAFLPTGMYHVCAFFHKLINTVKPIPLSRSVLLFCSLCGSLIFIPIYFLSCEIYRNRTVAYITAFLAGIIPAYLHRSLCYWYRYEIIGTPILFMSLLFFIKAFSASGTKRTFLYSIISAIFMVLSLSVWRLSILFLIAYLLVFIYILFKRKDPFKKWCIIFFVVVGVSFLLFQFSTGFGSKGYNYGAFPKAMLQIIMDQIGIKQDFSAFTRLVYHSTELNEVTLVGMFNKLFLSFSGIFIIIYFFVYFKNKPHIIQKDILLVFLFFFLALTFIFGRIMIVFGPLCALTLGESITIAFKSRKILKSALMCLIVIALIKTGYDSYKLIIASYPHAKIRPSLKQALIAINKKTPKDAVILSLWADGYPIQTYCNRPTITDGLFESSEIVKRIINISKIYYSHNEDELWNFCKKYGVTHILVPTDTTEAYAGYARVEYSEYYQRWGPTSKGKATTLFKLIYAPKELNRFRRLFANKKFVLYSVKY